MSDEESTQAQHRQRASFTTTAEQDFLERFRASVPSIKPETYAKLMALVQESVESRGASIETDSASHAIPTPKPGA